MKKLLTIAFLLPMTIGASAQGVAIGTGTPTAHASAALDVQSTTQGILVPRMTTAQRTGIAAPAGGLLVFDTTSGSFWYYTGTAWQELVGGGPSAAGWSLTGNAGTDSVTNFIGTTDAQPLLFRANNAPAGMVRVGAPGLGNTSFGSNALSTGATGWYNCAFGPSALGSVSSGQFNVAVGAEALSSITTAGQNIGIGGSALRNNVSSTGNIAVGYQAMSEVTGGINNMAFGHRALQRNVSGQYNVVIGYEALDTANTGNNNMAIGRNALGSNLSGTSNVAMGSSALASNTTGNFNTAYGTSALSDNASSQLNTAIGYAALNNIVTGGSNTALGANSGPAVAGISNSTAIGNGATPSATNRITIGTSGNNNLTGGYGNWQNLSDGRFKRDVRDDVPGLAFIKRLRPVTYSLDAAALDRFLGVASRMAKLEDPVARQQYHDRVQEVSRQVLTGFVAQEVEQSAKDIGYQFDGVHHPVDEHDHYTLGYASFVVPLVKAVQEQQTMIEALRNELDAAAAERVELLRRLERIEANTQHQE